MASPTLASTQPPGWPDVARGFQAQRRGVAGIISARLKREFRLIVRRVSFKPGQVPLNPSLAPLRLPGAGNDSADSHRQRDGSGREAHWRPPDLRRGPRHRRISTARAQIAVGNSLRPSHEPLHAEIAEHGSHSLARRARGMPLRLTPHPPFREEVTVGRLAPEDAISADGRATAPPAPEATVGRRCA